MAAITRVGDQLDRLRLEGCHAGQGFYFSHPLEESDALEFLAARRHATPAGQITVTR